MLTQLIGRPLLPAAQISGTSWARPIPGLAASISFYTLSPLMWRQFTKNLTSNWAVYFTAAVISFFMTPYIIGQLGQSAYGIWVLVGSFSGYLGLFDFGIGYAVVRYVARYTATGETEKRNEIISAAFYAASVLAALVMVVTIGVMLNAERLFTLPPELSAQARMVILLIGISIAVGFPLSVFSETLAGGLYRQDLVNVVSLSMALIRTMMVVVLLEAGTGLVGLGVAALAGSIAAYSWRLFILIRLMPGLSVKPAHVNRNAIKAIGGYSLYSFILVLSSRLAFYSDSVVVGIFRPMADVAVFGIAVGLTEYLRQFVFTMTRLVSPLASRFDPEADQAALRRLYYDGTRLSLLVSLPVTFLLLIWGGRLIELWVGDRFVDSFPILQVLLVGHLLSFTQLVGGELLLGVGKHKMYALLSLAGAGVNVALSIALIQSSGLLGVAWGTTIPLAILSLTYMPIAVSRLVGAALGDFCRQALLRPLLAIIPSATFLIIMRPLLTNLISVISLGVVFGLMALISIWTFGLTAEEKKRLRSLRKTGVGL